MQQPTQTEIDAALIECLRIFARRGRQLREERKRAQGSIKTTENETKGECIACERARQLQTQKQTDVILQVKAQHQIRKSETDSSTLNKVVP